MTRVSENSHTASLKFAVDKAKTKMEDLQIKGAHLKKVVKPSDDPIGNMELMTLRSTKINNDQFKRNSSFALTSLEYTENSIKELTEILMKAKEIAVAQSSDLYNPDVRKSVAREVAQLRKQLMGIANRRLGNRYIFAGHKTLEKPFTLDGKYLGDSGVIHLEVLKDFYVPSNIPGNDVFFLTDDSKIKGEDPLAALTKNKMEAEGMGTKTRYSDLLNMEDTKVEENSKSLFNLLRMLENSLTTSNADAVQELLNEIDDFTDQMITVRTRIGSMVNTLLNSGTSLEEMELFNASKQSKIEDADIAELFSDLNKQGLVLQATYKTSAKLVNENLLDFLK